MVSYWIDLAFMLIGIRDVYVFKAISALRPIRLLSLTEGTSVSQNMSIVGLQSRVSDTQSTDRND